VGLDSAKHPFTSQSGLHNTDYNTVAYTGYISGALEEAEVIPGKHSDTRIRPLALTNGHGRYMLHYRYTRTETCVRWRMPVKYIAVKVFAVSLLKPPCNGRFTSETAVRWFQNWNRHLNQFYTYSYIHAHRLRLEKLLYLGLSRTYNGFLKPLLDPDGGFNSETAERRFRNLNGRYTAISELKWPLHGGFGGETDKNLTAIYLTDILQQT
jgi:hypothetical protein